MVRRDQRLGFEVHAEALEELLRAREIEHVPVAELRRKPEAPAAAWRFTGFLAGGFLGLNEQHIENLPRHRLSRSCMEP